MRCQSPEHPLGKTRLDRDAKAHVKGPGDIQKAIPSYWGHQKGFTEKGQTLSAELTEGAQTPFVSPRKRLGAGQLRERADLAAPETERCREPARCVAVSPEPSRGGVRGPPQVRGDSGSSRRPETSGAAQALSHPFASVSPHLGNSSCAASKRGRHRQTTCVPPRGSGGRGVSPARRPPEPLPNLAGRGKAAQNLLSDKGFSTCDCVSETRPPSSEQGEGAKQGDCRPRAAPSAAPRGPPRRAPGRARSCARETPGVLMSQALGSPFSVGRGARAAGRVGT